MRVWQCFCVHVFFHFAMMLSLKQDKCCMLWSICWFTTFLGIVHFKACSLRTAQDAIVFAAKLLESWPPLWCPCLVFDAPAPSILFLQLWGVHYYYWGSRDSLGSPPAYTASTWGFRGLKNHFEDDSSVWWACHLDLGVVEAWKPGAPRKAWVVEARRGVIVTAARGD